MNLLKIILIFQALLLLVFNLVVLFWQRDWFLCWKMNIKSKIFHSVLLDITFFRDDFRRSEKPLVANSTHIDFIVENKKVVFIDDVLYTGRSIRSALTAIQSFGRPSEIELLVLIDRRFGRHLPIQPDYKGRQVDAINKERVVVHLQENEGEDAVYIREN